MKRSLLGVLAVGLSFSLLMQAKPSGEPSSSGDPAFVYAVRALNQSLTAPCQVEIQPDRALIVGGVTVEGLKPLEVKAQLDKQLAAMEKYVEEQGGELRRLDLIRAVRESRHEQRGTVLEETPFILLQQLEIEFPLGTEIDAILERVLQLGLDRFGRNVTIGHRDANPKVVVRYGFSKVEGVLTEALHSCQQQAWEGWCARNVLSHEVKECNTAGPLVRRFFLVQSFQLQSQPVQTESSGYTPLYVNFPWNANQLAALEPLGARPLRLTGTLSIVVSGKP